MTGADDENAKGAESGAARDAASTLQEFMARLPRGRAVEETPKGPVEPPLGKNLAFRGEAIAAAEPAAPEVEPARKPAAPVAEPEVRQSETQYVLPRRARRMSTGRKIWFAVAYLAPVLLGAFYLFFLMPDQYSTEFRFSVRVPVGNPGALGQNSNGSSYSALFGGNPTPGTDLLDNFTVADYARSAQAARDLDAKVNLKSMYSLPSDPVSRLGASASAERLGRYWKWMVYSDYDVTTGLAVVRVRAYTAKDSLAIANTLLGLSNELVNTIGDQSQQDTVRFAKQQVDRAQSQVTELRRQIAVLSNDKGIDSPSIGVQNAAQAVATNTRNNISQIQSQIQVLTNQLHNPDAPQIVMLRQELAANERALATAVDLANSRATNRYNDLTAQLNSGLNVLAAAQGAYSTAQAAAASQRLYLTTYVRPTLPESPSSPDRWLDLLLLVIGSAMVWMIGLLIRNSIMEHGI